MENKGRILIVDDEIEICELLRNILIAENHEVKYLTDSEKFINEMNFYNQDNLDLIILDLMMPKIDGFQILDALNKNNNTRFIPRIVVSAYQSKDNYKDVYESGTFLFIEKPFDSDLLKYQVQALLRIKQYEDYHRNLIQLLKDKNKKFFFSEILKQSKALDSLKVDQIDNILLTIYNLIKVNSELLKSYIYHINIENSDINQIENKILKDLAVGMKSLDSTREQLYSIINFMKFFNQNGI